MTHEHPQTEAAAQLPAGDVLAILLEQHARIRELFRRTREAPEGDRERLFAELRRLLVVHETAEEMIVRPVTRAASGGGRVAEDRNAEEHAATRILADLERIGPSSAGFGAALASLESSVAAHAQREDHPGFPLLMATRNTQHRALLGLALRAAQLLAPTHAHASAAGSTIAQYVFGPLASVLDHTRDAAQKLLPR
jgi:hypothetical protein